MRRWISISVGAGAVALAIGITAKSFRAPTVSGSDATGRSGDAGTLENGPTHPQPSSLGSVARSEGPADPSSEALRGDSGTSGPSDGIPVPSLPSSAPRQVRFGVVLVSYSGAEPELNGDHPPTRSRADAKLLAEKLVVAAATDFHAAVQQGDPGSADDVGTVKLGILEPAAEYVLFSLARDGIGGPVDTPRGYWIVKRLE
jgi:hypothetical protein